ncbi:MAG: diadenylate cyclase [Pseudomonadota bacterium]
MDKLLLLTKVLKEMLSWKAVLDIFLIATLIFLIYRTFRTLGTWRVLLGILTAVTVFLIANLLELEGINWIYSNLSQVAVLGIIVIFQPEIRKVFERAVSLRRNEAGERRSDFSGLISDAVFALTQQKRGAIIVCPGKEPVRQWLAGGFALDAEPSLPLIMSIFDPNSPGHDGALIIENGRFVQFGVRLPISKTNRLSSEFGTRHHAAMGLSEVTDALVVAVSEEKGSVTTFLRGRLKTAGDKNELCSTIESHWQKTSSFIAMTSFKRYKWKVLPEICLSAVLALLFWATLATSYARIFERSVVVPVEYTAIPQNLVMVGNKPTEVKLRVAGPKPDLDAFGASQASVKINLSDAMAGRQTLAVNEESIKLPKKVRILDMEPASLSILLEEILQKELIVNAQLVGRLPQGLEVVSVDVSPKKVKALYPAGMGKKGEISLMTTPIYLEGIKEDTMLFCKIIGSYDIQPADKRWPDVQVHIKVGRK